MSSSILSGFIVPPSSPADKTVSELRGSSDRPPSEQDFAAAIPEEAADGPPPPSPRRLRASVFLLFSPEADVLLIGEDRSRRPGEGGGEALPPEHSVSLPAARLSGFLRVAVCWSALFDQMNPHRLASASAPGYKPTRAVWARLP